MNLRFKAQKYMDANREHPKCGRVSENPKQAAQPKDEIKEEEICSRQKAGIAPFVYGAVSLLALLSSEPE
jgi:hypothetical protein